MNSYISLEPQFIADMNNNLLNTVVAEADLFINDTTNPRIAYFDLDMYLGHLTLWFTETVNASSFVPSGITLQSELDSTDSTRYTLTNGSLLYEVDDYMITVVITNDDLNVIKSRGIALDNETAWLVVNSTTILDQSGQPVVPLQNALTAASVQSYIPDETSPVLQSFILDLHNESLILSFSETVDVYSFNITQFTLQNRARLATEQYSLSEESYTVLEYGPVVTISLATVDLNELKITLDLATDTSNTFINITKFALTDRNSNRVVPTNTTLAINATRVIQDENIPMLESFSLDLNLGILYLAFSETVQASSINVTEISLQNEKMFNINMTIVYNLTGGTVASSDGPDITIELSEFDLNEIKLITDLATEFGPYENISTNTFLTLTLLSVRDNNFNQINQYYHQMLLLLLSSLLILLMSHSGHLVWT